MDKNRVAQLVAIGIPDTQVAAAVGVTPGRISQAIKDDHELQGLIVQYQSARASVEIQRTATLDSIETKLIHKVDDLVDSVESLGEAVGALERLHKLKSVRLINKDDNQSKRPNIYIGAIIQTKLNMALTSTNEIVEIDGRLMATMPTQQVIDLIKLHGISNEVPA